MGKSKKITELKKVKEEIKICRTTFKNIPLHKFWKHENIDISSKEIKKLECCFNNIVNDFNKLKNKLISSYYEVSFLTSKEDVIKKQKKE